MKNLLKTNDLRFSYLILFAMFAIACLVRIWYAARFPLAMDCYPDELRYYRIAASFFNGTGISIYNAPCDFQKILYSIFILPAFFFESVATRFYAIFTINSLLMSAGVFPVYYLAKQFINDNLKRFSCCFIYLIFGFQTYTMTFMSENLWIPLVLTLLCVFYKLLSSLDKEENRKVFTLSLLAGLLSYAAYLTKEIALIFPLAYSGYIITLLFGQKFILKEPPLYRRYLFSLLIYLLAFSLPFIIFKLTIFHGMGNSYNQQSLDALFGKDSIQFLYYGFIYYLSNILLMSHILPVLLPAAYADTLRSDVKKFFCFTILLLLAAALIISYTITIREDIARPAPRAHMRYMAWIAIIFIMIFFHMTDKEAVMAARGVDSTQATEQAEILLRKISWLRRVAIALILVFLPVFYKLTIQGSNVDHTMWLLINLHGNAIFFFLIGGGILTIIGSLMYEKFPKTLCLLTFLLITGTQICDNIKGIDFQNKAHHITDLQAESAAKLLKFTQDHPNETFLVFEHFNTPDNKVLDTWLTLPNMRFTDINKFLEKFGTQNIRLAEIEIPIIWSGEYKKKKIDYVIVKKGMKLAEDTNCHKQENINTTLYDVYKITDSSQPINIYDGYLEAGDSIFLSGSSWNASQYIKAGISHNENSFTWTDGKELIFKKTKFGKENNQKEYNMHLYLNGTFNGEQTLRIYCNNKLVFNQVILKERELVVPISTSTDGYLDIRFEMPDAASPQEKGQSSDSRKLSLQLTKITFEKH